MSLETLLGTAAITVLVVIVSLVMVIVSRGRHPERLSRRLGLALPDDPALRDEILRRGRHRTLWVSVGACLGFVVTIAIVLAAAVTGLIPDPGTGAAWTGLAGLVLGGAIAALCVVLGSRHPVDPSRPRVAHARRTELADYLDPIELVGARVVAGLGAVATALALALPGSSWMMEGQPLAAGVLAVGGLIGLVLLELGGRRVVLARPRVADTPVALAWDDATRATELRALATAPLMMGAYSLAFGSFASLGPALRLLPDVAAGILINVTFFVLLAALVTVAVVATSRKPEQFYLRRLWPEVAAANAANTRTRYSR